MSRSKASKHDYEEDIAMRKYILGVVFAGVSQTLLLSGADATSLPRNYYTDTNVALFDGAKDWNESQTYHSQYFIPVWGYEGRNDYYYRPYRRPYRYYQPYYYGSYYDRDCY